MQVLRLFVKLKVTKTSLHGIGFHSSKYEKVFGTRPRIMGSIVSCGKSYNVSGSKTDVNSEQGSRAMSTTSDSEYVESIVCKEAEIPEEGMKEFEIEGSKVLVTKSQGQFSAIGGKCTHYGAPLSKGAVCNGKIRCPFHGACFDLKTGDIEDFPGLDSLPTFEVDVSNGDVKVKAKKSVLANAKRVKQLAKRDPAVSDTVVVIGGGASGANCVETLRQEGFTGRIILTSAETELPYDRPRLSKMMHMTADKLALRTQEFYQEADIEVKLGCAAVGLNATDKTIKLSSGETISFDKCLIATGGRPRRLSTPGCDLKGVYILRTPADGNAIMTAAKDKAIVIVGTSFIGMEAAAYFANQERAATVTIIGNSSVPFERSLGSAIGARMQSLFEEKGVKFINNASVSEIKGENDAVAKVVLNDGSEINADLVLAGIGVTPSTEFLQGSGITLDERGYIPVNQYMETNIRDIYAAGDIASFPLSISAGTRACIGHWQIANKHGHVAALNMLDKGCPITTVPFFWTMFFGKSVRYAGHGSYDDVVISGNLDDLSFIAYYCKEDRVVAVATLGRDPGAARFANYLQNGKILKKERVLEDGEVVLKLSC